MKPKILIIGAVFVWVFSVTGAYLLGQSGNPNKSKIVESVYRLIGGDKSAGTGYSHSSASTGTRGNPDGGGAVSASGAGGRPSSTQYASGPTGRPSVERRKTGSLLGPEEESGGSEKGTGASGRRGSKKGGGAGGGDDGAGQDQFSGIAAEVFQTLNIEDRLEREQAFNELLDQISPDNVLAIAEVFQLRRAQGLPYGDEYTNFAHRWGQLDGASALAHMAQQEAPSWASEAAVAALRGWTLNDPEGVQQWISQLGENRWSDSVIRGHVQGLAENDIAAARQFALSMRGRTDVAPLFSDIYNQILNDHGLGRAQTWFENLPAADLHVKRQIFDEVTRSKLRVGVEEATAWINQNSDSPYRDDLAVRRVAAHLTNENPIAALDWVLNLPPSPLTNQIVGIEDVIGTWRTDQIDNLGEALSSRETSPGYDEAAAQFAYRINRIDDDAAQAWAATIKDQDYRNVVLRRLKPD